MDGKGDPEAGVGEWEFVNNDEPVVVIDDVVVAPELDSNSSVIRPDHFSLNSNPNSSCSSNSNSNSSSEVDRNFDDSYVANQLFPNSISSSNLPRWNDSDSGSDFDATNHALTEPETAEAEVDVGFDSKEEEEEEVETETEEKEERRVVWWKVPFEVLKYWVTPLSLPLSVPISVAAAAALLGLLMLGRRLYKMKRKTQTLKLNLALDDKVDSFLFILI